MTIAQQIALNSRTGAAPSRPEALSGFLRDWAEMPAPVMENDHEGSLYPATPQASPEAIRRSIREFAKLMS